MTAYRQPPDAPDVKHGPVTVATYVDVFEAELARTRLGAEGIEAVVREPTGIYPLITGAAGAVRLEVDESDRIEAEHILTMPDVDRDDDDDDQDDGDVRCPRCELLYCTFVASRKHWRCQRCEHVWTDATEGPRKATRRHGDDPRPVFRLRRTSPGMGLFIGFIAGVPTSFLVGGPFGAFAWLGLLAGGWMIGGSLGSDFCSEPRCRTKLPPGTDECPGCKGAIAGAIQRASQHYSAVADVRRELAEVHERASKKKKRRGLKK